MRPVERIDETLALIKLVWDKYPDLRLMQLLGNALPSGDNYYVEDDVLLAQLEGQYCKLLGVEYFESKKQGTAKNLRNERNSKPKSLGF